MIPIEFYKNILTILGLESYGSILAALEYEDRKYVTTEIARAAIKYGHKITSSQETNKLFDLLQVLIKEADDVPDDYHNYSFDEEQNLVARFVHLLDNDSTDDLFKIYAIARKHFGQGGVQRIQYTLPPLVFAYLRLAERINNVETEASIREEKVFQYIIEILEVLANQNPDVALKLFLQSAQCADNCKMEHVCFELMSQALLLYEEQDSKVQLDSLALIVNTLQSFKSMEEGNYDTLSTKTCQYSSKLLRKPDQCKAAFQCSHLFWPMDNNVE